MENAKSVYNNVGRYVLAAVVLVLFSQSGFCGTYGGGLGSAEYPFLISTAEHMQEIGTNFLDWDKHFILMADIDLGDYTGEEYNIIGNMNAPFNGVFDGAGHIISNLTIDRQSVQNNIGYIGLLGLLGKSGEIKNLVMANANITITHLPNSYYVGSLVGSNRGFVTNCYATSNVFCVSGIMVGGLVGRNTRTITDCYANTSVVGQEYVGGLAGRNEGYFTSSYIANSFATGSVTGYAFIGGLTGSNYVRLGYDTSSTITDSYTNCAVSGHNDIGGLTGVNGDTIINSYSVGRCTGTIKIGGFAGTNYGTGIFASCFWDSDVNAGLTGVGNIDDPTGVMGRTTFEMQTQSTFTDAGWDFVGEDFNGVDDVWKIREGVSYPQLSWRSVAGDVVGGWRVDLFDLAEVAKWYGEVNGLCDFDESGFVDLGDVMIMAENWLDE